MSLEKPGHTINLVATKVDERFADSIERESYNMFWLKACPKCHGDLHMESDSYGAYISCLQCSHYLSAAEDARLKLSMPEAVKRPSLIDQMVHVAA